MDKFLQKAPACTPAQVTVLTDSILNTLIPDMHPLSMISTFHPNYELPHTAANTAEWIEEIIAKFNIPPEKIKAVVHENGANVVAAAKMLHEKHGWASAKGAEHTFNLVVQNSLKSQQAISKCVAAARSLVEHLKKSELACTMLRVKQMQMDTK